MNAFDGLRVDQIDHGYWGPHTSTIDWCELNYTHTPYIAEFINTLTNLPVIILSIYGFFATYHGGIPTRYALCYLGLALVGIGSFGFHASLRWEWQLMDELPMIYDVTWSTYLTFDTLPSSEFRGGRYVPLLVLAWDVLVTLSYTYAPNPVYHQVAFAFILISGLVRNVYLLSNLPADSQVKQQVTRTVINGVIIFAGGFAIWNVDNVLCDQLRRIRDIMGPWGIILEGHAYWHLMTGYGAFLIFTASVYLCLSIKTTPESYTYDPNSFFPIVRAVRPPTSSGTSSPTENPESIKTQKDALANINGQSNVNDDARTKVQDEKILLRKKEKELRRK